MAGVAAIPRAVAVRAAGQGAGGAAVVAAVRAVGSGLTGGVLGGLGLGRSLALALALSLGLAIDNVLRVGVLELARVVGRWLSGGAGGLGLAALLGVAGVVVAGHGG